MRGSRLRLPAFVAVVTVAAACLLDAQTRPAATRPAATRPARAVASRPTTQEAIALQQLADDLRVAYSKPPAEWPPAEVDPGVNPVELGLLPEPTYPKANPYSKAKADLGGELFFEPRLSGSGQFACASCHNPELGWTDGTALSFGHDRQNAKRNAPTIQNSAFKTSYFWDGRAATLEDQVLVPLTNDTEMHGDAEQAVERLSAMPAYAKMFKAAFGDDTIDVERMQEAIATFERSQVGGRSKFDFFLRGRTGLLGDDAVRGLHLFRTKAGCMNCHNGPDLTDNQFHNLGLSYYGRKLQDLGRYEITKMPQDVGAFRTPSLRNVERTAPYMHNGLFDLDGVLNLYNAGMPTLRPRPGQENDPLFPTKDKLLHPLRLSRQEIADLKAFLLSLTEPRQRLVKTAEPPADASTP